MGRPVAPAGDRSAWGVCGNGRSAVRSSLLAALAAGLACFLHATAANAAETSDGTLRVCLDENVPPYSVKQAEAGTGFDVLISQALAKRLGQPLAVQWYESKLDL